MEMVFGLAGAALGLALFGAGAAWERHARRRAPGARQADRTAEKAGPPVMDDAQWRQLYNFLSYDGGDMPRDGDAAEGKSKRGGE